MNTSADLSRATKEGAIYILVCVGLISIETLFNMQRQDEFLSRGLWLQCVCGECSRHREIFVTCA
jgi:hypothetical protein